MIVSEVDDNLLPKAYKPKEEIMIEKSFGFKARSIINELEDCCKGNNFTEHQGF